MKIVLCALGVASILATPSISFSQQTSSTVTREQVQMELVQLEKAGYNPVRHDRYYPKDLWAAQARIAAQKDLAHGQSNY